MTTKVKNAGIEFDDGSLQTTAFDETKFSVYYLYEDLTGDLNLDIFAGGGSDTYEANMAAYEGSIFYAPSWKGISINVNGELVLTI